MHSDIGFLLILLLTLVRDNYCCAELEEQKAQLLKEKQRVNEVHSKIGREYREMTTLLAGFQFKMKEDGLYQVQSIYEKLPDNCFLFKVRFLLASLAK